MNSLLQKESTPSTHHWKLFARRGRILRHRLAVLAEVGKLAAVTMLLLHIEGDAGINRARVDMNADGALTRIIDIEELMDRLQLVGSQNRPTGVSISLANAVEPDMI